MLRLEDAFPSFLFSSCVSQFVCLSSMEADIFPIHCSLLSNEDQKEREKEKGGGGGGVIRMEMGKIITFLVLQSDCCFKTITYIYIYLHFYF